MSLMLIDYINLVMEYYEEKRGTDTLPTLLKQPTRANIRQECLNVYRERKRRGEALEEDTLRAFFGVPRAGRDLESLIESCEADKFRQVQKIINKRIKRPKQFYVELLAWLIDFQPRPFSTAQKVLDNPPPAGNTVRKTPEDPVPGEKDMEPTGPGTLIIMGTGTSTGEKEEERDGGKRAGETGENLEDEQGPKNQERNSSGGGEEKKDDRKEGDKTGGSQEGGQRQDNPGKSGSSGEEVKPRRWRLKVTAFLGLSVVIISGGIYGFWRHAIDDNNACVYWTGDHYESVPCDENSNGRNIIPNTKQRENLKKITRKDTITEWSIGRVYYISNSNNADSDKIEYYTSAGEYPEDPKRSLRKLTRHIFEKDSVNRKVSY